MTPDRRFKLALWLRELAVYELGTARALTKLGHLGNARPCATRAKLFIEVARELEEAGEEADSAPLGHLDAPEPESPPAGSASHPSRRKRL